MTRKIIFRADGNATTGLGHLYRIFALVEMCKIDYEFIFITKQSSTLSSIPRSYNTKLIPESISIEQEPDWLASLFDSSLYFIVADGYQFSSTYQKKIKEKGFKLIYIDDLAKEHMYADVVVNHSPFAQESHFSKELYTKLALGTKYALLRPLFLDEAKQNKSIQIIDIAFVCFGGVDSLNLTQKAIEAILKIPNFKQIHVVLGGAYPHEGIFVLEKKYSNKITIHQNLPEIELINVMKQCNFAIAPASTILYELLCVKMPVLSGFYVENQKNIYKGFLNNEAIYKGGNMKNFQTSDFINNIIEILEGQTYNQQMQVQMDLFDAEIALRHLSLIKEIC
jgi:UDP-2,4-diacetamido-2,4,6-trideoxy-beta-L-altropyranose hydrolase